MAPGSSSKTLAAKFKKQKGTGSNPPNNDHIETFVPKRDHDPRDLRSWAKRTGFVSIFSGETAASTSTSTSGNFRNERGRNVFDLGKGNRNTIEEERENSRVDKDAGNEERRGFNGNGNGNNDLGSINEERRVGVDENNVNNGGGNGNGNGFSQTEKEEFDGENGVGFYDRSPNNPEDPIFGRHPKIFNVKSGVLDNPGFVPVIYYGMQHYLSLAGSLVLIPLIMVPAMGGTDKDTASVMSTMLLVSGIATLLHSFFGTRLPLVQGSSFVYLAPALVIMNSQEFRNLTQHKFRYIMRELQGAIIIGSLFQSIMGFSGLMSLLLRLINPVVVAPTIAAVGLAFFSYGFPQAGSCVEISMPQILLVLIFTLYIRGVSISGHRVFQIYAVATYYNTSLRVNSKPPTPGIVARGIGMEGFCSLLAGLWGTGTGSATLTENMHTISITEVANRRGVQLGSVLIILLSFIGKVGGILASIPQALAASALCFIWALTVALGLLNMQYTQASSFRNMGIVGASLFFGLSIPAYFQQFEPEINLILPSYLIPYAAASNGPIHTGNHQLDFAMNGLLSMNMVVSFLIAFVLDNTVPGSKQERGIYRWSTSEDLASDASSQASYRLPSRVASVCCWAKCLGV
ncbi:nucleobase-ascorbate transporter 11 isoform X2 [Beta vulgaris subsp. vulgaris]|uniref:nucleobase-ascorbate transporter 11 isoform X2 n=1 Tax=Beta vulgaris subsp. vulgaris TaxID=3555 RepID=UPI00053FD938|nr:nucleobase-ascorbate transporter 11 isoform X2 [Beta vulgaris subsp. vulgaris]